MSNKYELLEDLERLRKAGTISEEEYQRERTKVLNSDIYIKNQERPLAMEENTYLMLMHISQFAGLLTLGLGFIIPIIMWLVNKDKSENVDKHGKNILNFMISWIIYALMAFILIITIILSLVGIPLLALLAILQIIFVIIATVNAASGVYWKYPLCIPFFS